MSKNVNERDATDSLQAWMNYVVVDLSIHKRSEWAHTLGVTPQSIGTWLSGEKFPRAEVLRELVSVLTSTYELVAHKAIDAWGKLSAKPLRQVWPGETRTDAPTLAHYIVSPLWERLRLSVQSQRASDQDRLLSAFLDTTNRYRLSSLGSKSSQVQVTPPSHEQIREVAPCATNADSKYLDLVLAQFRQGRAWSYEAMMS